MKELILASWAYSGLWSSFWSPVRDRRISFGVFSCKCPRCGTFLWHFLHGDCTNHSRKKKPDGKSGGQTFLWSCYWLQDYLLAFDFGHSSTLVVVWLVPIGPPEVGSNVLDRKAIQAGSDASLFLSNCVGRLLVDLDSVTLYTTGFKNPDSAIISLPALLHCGRNRFLMSW